MSTVFDESAVEQVNGNDNETSKNSWPELIPEAQFGLAGDFVRAVGPHTEADPVALLMQFFVAFGNVIGRGPHFVAEADEHFSNLFI